MWRLGGSGWLRRRRQPAMAASWAVWRFAEAHELRRAFAVAEPVEHLPGGEIERGEHVPDPPVRV